MSGACSFWVFCACVIETTKHNIWNTDAIFFIIFSSSSNRLRDQECGSCRQASHKPCFQCATYRTCSRKASFDVTKHEQSRECHENRDQQSLVSAAQEHIRHQRNQPASSVSAANS